MPNNCQSCNHWLFLEHSPIPPPDLQLLRSRIIPDGAERAGFKHIIHEHDLVIAQIQDDVAYLDNMRANVLLRKEAFEANRARYASLMAPIRALPPEILQRILSLSVELSEFYRRGTFPFCLAAVCTSWREVALDSAELWKHVKMDLDRGPKDTRLALGVPKTFSVTFRKFLEDRVQTIIRHSSRWWRIDFSLPDFPWDLDAPWKPPKISGVAFPALQQLSFAQQYHAVISFRNAPLLRSVEFQDDVDNPAEFELPWSQLTYCRMSSNMNLDSCWTILESCTHLTSFSYRIRGERSTHSQRHGLVVLPNLYELTMSYYGWDKDTTLPLISSLSLPALRRLSITEEQHYRRAAWGDPLRTQVVSLMRECARTLRTVYLANMVGNMSVLYETLPYLHSLMELEFDFHNWPDVSLKALLQHLTDNPDHSPRLQKLTIECHDVLSKPKHGRWMAALVTSRLLLQSAPTCDFRAVIVKTARPAYRALVALAHLHAQGFDVSVLWEGKDAMDRVNLDDIDNLQSEPSSMSSPSRRSRYSSSCSGSDSGSSS